MSEETNSNAMGTGYFCDREPGRKGEILDAALEVFGEYGYDGGSMRQIASRIGVTEPALYRHYAGKEAIFIALMRAGACTVRDETFVLIDSLEPGRVREQLLEMLKDRRHSIRFFGPLLRIILPAAANNERFRDEYLKLIVAPARERVTMKAVEIDEALGVHNAAASRDSRVRAFLALMVGYMVSSIVIGDEPDEAIVDAAICIMRWDRG